MVQCGRCVVYTDRLRATSARDSAIICPTPNPATLPQLKIELITAICSFSGCHELAVVLGFSRVSATFQC